MTQSCGPQAFCVWLLKMELSHLRSSISPAGRATVPYTAVVTPSAPTFASEFFSLCIGYLTSFQIKVVH